MSVGTGSIPDLIARQSWVTKAALVIVACVVLTVLSPVLVFSCARGGDGAVSCRVLRCALGVVPYASTTIGRVGDADAEFAAGGVRRASRGGKAYFMSESVVALRDADAGEWLEWTTYADVGADGIAIAIDELVEGRRTEPFLGWRANVWTILIVFCGALPFAAAMLGRTACDVLRVDAKRSTVIERAYVVTLVLGALFAIVAWWGSVPAFVAGPLGLPTGWTVPG